ncbi:putative oxidoreductase [Flavobacterium sp. 270]|uniref:DoxX family protein n=1 Tax=Flavobacterium sp. 270 TaxID=2512114 RepID=UPI0010F0492E|nr:DoxX family protein [Flavobacterium sp. 270]TDW47784.1 putative oxidoreductase [Flavobacterium sp. 270]
MKNIFFSLMRSNVGTKLNDVALFFFRIAVSIELIYAHGLKKIGIGTALAEVVPNPLGLPEALNQVFATAANLVMPIFIILGLMTRLATLPILAVTLTGYFVLHFNDPILVKDVPFMYSLCFLLICFTGAGKYSVDHYIISRNLFRRK